MARFGINNHPKNKLLNQRIVKIFLLLAALASVYGIMHNTEILNGDEEEDRMLVFKNPQLESGTAGNIGAVYRFAKVKEDIDALVEIISIENASLVNIDLATTGDPDSFQPQVKISTQRSGGSTGYMDFKIKFVMEDTNIPVPDLDWVATAVDVDGDNYRIRESVGFGTMNSYILENPSLLSKNFSSGEVVFFDANTTSNKPGITVTATDHMITAKYTEKNDFLYRTRIIADPSSRGSSSADKRMFSLNFDPGLEESYVAPNTFPVELIGFDGKVLGDRILLNWSTASELNNDHFEIERSIDGIGFSSIGQVAGQGNSQEIVDYQFTDNLPSEGTNYYRLKQVDFDGQFEYSETLTLKAEPTGFQLHAYPNPATDFLNVSVKGDQTIENLELLNISGQRVHTPIAKKSYSEWELSVSHLPAGAYFVRLETEQAETPLQKIIIQ